MRGKEIILALSILIFSVAEALWALSQFPPMMQSSSLALRIASGMIGVVIVGLCIFIGKAVFRKNSLALASGFFLATQPWFVQEMRIFSPFMYATGILVICLFIIGVVKSEIMKRTLLLLIVLGFSAVFLVTLQHPVSMFSLDAVKHVLQNLSSLLSFETFFVKNGSFWFGETLDNGIFLPVLFPFLMLGLFQLHRLGRYLPYFGFWIGGSILLTVINPAFPEGRYFFMGILPLIFVIVLGLEKIKMWNNRNLKSAVVVATVISYSYSYMYFLHTYLLHNSLKVLQFMDKIYGRF